MTLVGEFDYMNLGLLEPVLLRALAAPAEKVIVDLRRTDFLDPAALKLLLTASRLSHQHGVALVVVKPTTALWRIFVVTGSDLELPLCSSLPKALVAVGATD